MKVQDAHVYIFDIDFLVEYKSYNFVVLNNLFLPSHFGMFEL